ncbi:MAG: RNA methyltransferase substrate-binding domain-containing protein [Acidobacteriota bacterium]
MPMMDSVSQLTSKSNPLLKKIRLLGSGKSKKHQDLVLAEGLRVLEEVGRSGHIMDAVVASEHFGSEPREKKLLEDWMRRKVRLYQVKDNLFQTLSCYQTSQGALAVVRVPEARLPEINEKNALILYANGIQDPGNLGTLIRAAAANRLRQEPENGPIECRCVF